MNDQTPTVRLSDSLRRFHAQANAAAVAMNRFEQAWKDAHPGWREVAPGILEAPNGETLER